MRKKESKFLTWFEEQAGKPMMDEKAYYELRDQKVPSLRGELENAEFMLKQMRDYQIRKQYALYAWIARDKI